MKKYLIIFLYIIFNIIKGQVIIHPLGTIGEADGSAMLEIQSNDKGFLLPQIELTSLTDVATISGEIVEGLMVYNTNENPEVGLYLGYYYWTGSSWDSIGVVQRDITVSDVFETNVLGYDPIGFAATAANTVSVGGIQGTKVRCSKWIPQEGGNNHSYCIYELNSSSNWEQSFNIAKELSGYLPTITSNREWFFILSNVIKDGFDTNTGDFSSNNFWIGYNRRGFLNNDGSADTAVKFRYTWITGEIDKTNWTVSSVDTQFDNLDLGTSDVSSKNCGYILSESFGKNVWGATDCASSNTNYLIVEFNN